MRTGAGADFSRVTRREPCRICGKPDYCTRTRDGRTSFCMRVDSGSTGQAHNGGWIHRHDDGQPDPFRPRPVLRAKPAEPTIASVIRRDQVYTGLLDRLTLTAKHAAVLHAKGVTPELVVRALYSSVPESAEERQRIADDLAGEHDLSGVPGFFRRAGRWTIDPPRGILIPCRDVLGRIAGMQIRRDRADDGGKYVWLSSRDRPGGTPAQPSIHVASPSYVDAAHFALLTEGFLKSDITADLLDCAVLGLPGVTSCHDQIAPTLGQLGPLRAVFVAVDADFTEQPQVAAALDRILDQLARAAIYTEVLTWPRHRAKGIDDLAYLLARWTA